MGVVEIISLLLNVIFGGGLWLSVVQLWQLREQKDEEIRRLKVDTKQVETTVAASEIQNVENIARLWREQAEMLEEKLNTMHAKMEKLETDLLKVTRQNNKMYRLIDKMSKENWEQLVEQLREEFKEEFKSYTKEN